MNYTVKIAGLGVIFALAACDSKSSVEVPRQTNTASASANVVYLPDGGGVEFENAFVNEKEGAGWKYKEFTFDDDWEVLRGALKETMLQQGYEELGSIDLQGFESSLSFAKKGSARKVNYRVKNIGSVAGEKLLLRLSWNI